MKDQIEEQERRKAEEERKKYEERQRREAESRAKQEKVMARKISEESVSDGVRKNKVFKNASTCPCHMKI